jgi:hypothetical protein
MADQDIISRTSIHGVNRPCSDVSLLPTPELGVSLLFDMHGLCGLGWRGPMPWGRIDDLLAELDTPPSLARSERVVGCQPHSAPTTRPLHDPAYIYLFEDRARADAAPDIEGGAARYIRRDDYALGIAWTDDMTLERARAIEKYLTMPGHRNE